MREALEKEALGITGEVAELVKTESRLISNRIKAIKLVLSIAVEDAGHEDPVDEGGQVAPIVVADIATAPEGENKEPKAAEEYNLSRFSFPSHHVPETLLVN